MTPARAERPTVLLRTAYARPDGATEEGAEALARRLPGP